MPAAPSNANIFDYLKNTPESAGRGGGGGRANSAAPPATAPAQSAVAVNLAQSYTVQYIAHAPLEPRAAVAQFDSAGKLIVWTGTQRPFGVKDELVAAFHLAPEKVRVIQPDMGAGYGGKHTGDAAVEAARLAKAAGAPVKVVWTREEEFTWAYLRPAGLMELKASVNPDGTIASWEHHNYNSGNAGLPTPYHVTSPVTQYHASKSPLRQGSYRGLASTANHFARESLMDELAHAVNMDPLAFRLKKPHRPAPHQRVLNAATGKVRLGRSEIHAHARLRPRMRTGERRLGRHLRRSRHRSCNEEDSTSPASCKALGVGRHRQPRRPPQSEHGSHRARHRRSALRSTSPSPMAASTTPRFSDYRVPRFADAPHIDIVLIDRKDIASAGAGETGLVGLAPAVGNAIFAATGSRIRQMPMAPSDKIPGLPASPLTS